MAEGATPVPEIFRLADERTSSCSARIPTMDEVRKPPGICLAFDHNYVVPAAVTIASALDTCQYEGPEVFVIDLGLSKYDIDFVSGLSDKVRVITPSARDVRDLQRFSSRGYVNWTTYGRLLVPALLPLESSRVIYIDCDTLVLRDITDLWNKPLEGKPLGAVLDYWMPESHIAKLFDSQATGRGEPGRYFNAGVLLMDLDGWRAEAVADRTMELLERSDPFLFLDQDALNLVLCESWTTLPQLWNDFALDPSKSPKADSRAATDPDYLRASIRRSAVLHFVGKLKPWIDQYLEEDIQAHYGAAFNGIAHRYHSRLPSDL